MPPTGSTATGPSGTRASIGWTSASAAARMPSVTERLGIRLTRVFDAPRERLWKEWTEPERFADWFGGVEAKVPSVEMDVREGGAWHLTMEVDHRMIHWHGAYQEVDEPARVVFTISDRAPEHGYHMITVDLADLGDGRT